MIDSKVFQLLKEFNKEEFKDLEKFVASPYFSSGRNFTPLYEIIKPYHPEFSSDRLTKEKIFEHLYTKEKYVPQISDNKIKILFSGFYKLCMEFLSYSGFKADKIRQEIYLLDQLRNKKQYKEFQRSYSISKIDNDEMYKGSFDSFIEKFFLRKIQKSYLIDISDFEESFEASIQMHEYLSVACVIACLKYESEKTLMEGYNIVARESFVSDLLDSLDLEKLLKRLNEGNNNFREYINVYYTLHMMEKTKEEKYFYELRSLLKKNFNLFGRIESYNFWTLMCAFCMRKHRVTAGDKFDRELFVLHKEMLEYNIYNPDDISHFKVVPFRNMIIVASDLKEFTWLEEFIKKYSEELDPEYKSSISNYAHALVAFGTGNFESAINYISKINYDLFLYKMDIKRLLLRIYYELEYYDQLYSTIDSTAHYLKATKEIPESLKIMVRNFINSLKELVRLRLNNDSSGRDADFLRKSIEENKSIVNREWLLEKVHELRIG